MCEENVRSRKMMRASNHASAVSGTFGLSGSTTSVFGSPAWLHAVFWLDVVDFCAKIPLECHRGSLRIGKPFSTAVGWFLHDSATARSKS